MYVSAVIYPITLIQTKIPDYAWLVQYNPLAYIIETFRYMLLDTGTISFWGIGYTIVFTIIIFIIGILLFNKTEKNFIDTV